MEPTEERTSTSSTSKIFKSKKYFNKFFNVRVINPQLLQFHKTNPSLLLSPSIL